MTSRTAAFSASTSRVGDPWEAETAFPVRRSPVGAPPRRTRTDANPASVAGIPDTHCRRSAVHGTAALAGQLRTSVACYRSNACARALQAKDSGALHMPINGILQREPSYARH
jgi:hypothetical protein